MLKIFIYEGNRPDTISIGKGVNNLMGFLKNASLVQANLVPDKNGLVNLKDVNLNRYSTLHVLATDSINTVSKV